VIETNNHKSTIEAVSPTLSKDEQIESLLARVDELEMKLQSKESDLEALEF